ncbi:hypothetical protein M422DRAFT_248998 [Sphaerobolus stellatus SS14]|nr:hypothetical protein M422DRAFT_248998 [Sphaerobolus stellatus SS14]
MLHSPHGRSTGLPSTSSGGFDRVYDIREVKKKEEEKEKEEYRSPTLGYIDEKGLSVIYSSWGVSRDEPDSRDELDIKVSEHNRISSGQGVSPALRTAQLKLGKNMASPTKGSTELVEVKINTELALEPGPKSELHNLELRFYSRDTIWDFSPKPDTDTPATATSTKATAVKYRWYLESKDTWTLYSMNQENLKYMGKYSTEKLCLVQGFKLDGVFAISICLTILRQRGYAPERVYRFRMLKSGSEEPSHTALSTCYDSPNSHICVSPDSSEKPGFQKVMVQDLGQPERKIMINLHYACSFKVGDRMFKWVEVVEGDKAYGWKCHTNILDGMYAQSVAYFNVRTMSRMLRYSPMTNFPQPPMFTFDINIEFNEFSLEIIASFTILRYVSLFLSGTAAVLRPRFPNAPRRILSPGPSIPNKVSPAHTNREPLAKPEEKVLYVNKSKETIAGNTEQAYNTNSMMERIVCIGDFSDPLKSEYRCTPFFNISVLNGIGEDPDSGFLRIEVKDPSSRIPEIKLKLPSIGTCKNLEGATIQYPPPNQESISLPLARNYLVPDESKLVSGTYSFKILDELQARVQWPGADSDYQWKEKGGLWTCHFGRKEIATFKSISRRNQKLEIVKDYSSLSLG